MYACIKSSINGDVKDTIFTQFANLPAHEDGVALFKQLTTFTTVASLQLLVLSFMNILQFSPFDFQFNIPVINSKLLHLFVLATTASRYLLDSKRIQHTLDAYSKILQLESWAQWVCNQIDSFDEGKITVCQYFMNSATIKYNKIIGSSFDGNFQGSITTVQEDIVAMMVQNIKKRNPPPSKIEDDDRDLKCPKREPVPFANHYQDSSGVKYKLGDTKEHNDRTFYYCNCPIHRNRLKWHTYSPEKYRTRLHWLNNKDGKSDGEKSNAATANIADENDAYNTSDGTKDESNSNDSH